jgi:threonine/homoserine/homoserine lactone efflux protein
VPEPQQWWVFIIASVLLLITPGPAVLYVVTRSLDQGRLAGMMSVAGITLGTLAHVAFTTFGVAALLSANPLAFALVKWGGALYLVNLGLQRLRERELLPTGGGGARIQPASLARVFGQGVVVNLLNPKTALFFIAFLPQFVQPASPLAPQLFALGVTFTTLGFTTDSLYALLAGGMQRALTRSRLSWWPRAQRWLIGSVFIALGVTAALTPGVA